MHATQRVRRQICVKTCFYLIFYDFFGSFFAKKEQKRPCGSHTLTGRRGCRPSAASFFPLPQGQKASPQRGEVARRGGGREHCHCSKYFGQSYSSLPHRLRAEPFGPRPLCRFATSPHAVGSHPRRGGQGVSTPFSTGWKDVVFLKTPASLPALVGKLW